MSDNGRRMAESWASKSPSVSAAARRDILAASPDVQAAVARRLVELISASKPSATRACKVLSSFEAPQFAEPEWKELIGALMLARGEAGELGSAASSAYEVVSSRGPAVRAEVHAAPIDPPSMGVRLLSVLGRAWVWLALVVLTAVSYGLDEAGQAGLAIFVLVSALPILALVDAYLRRCPACGSWLAAEHRKTEHSGSYQREVTVQNIEGSMETVQQTVDTYQVHWGCSMCGHRW